MHGVYTGYIPGACEVIRPTSIPMDHMIAKIPLLTGGKNTSYGVNTKVSSRAGTTAYS